MSSAGPGDSLDNKANNTGLSSSFRSRMLAIAKNKIQQTQINVPKNVCRSRSLEGASTSSSAFNGPQKGLPRERSSSGDYTADSSSKRCESLPITPFQIVRQKEKPVVQKPILIEPAPLPSRILQRRYSSESVIQSKKKYQNESLGWQPRHNHRHPWQAQRQRSLIAYQLGVNEEELDEDYYHY